MFANKNTLREVSNINVDLKDRIATTRQLSGTALNELRNSQGAISARLSGGNNLSQPRYSFARPSVSSPRIDEQHAGDPTRCSDIAGEIVEMFHLREKSMTRNANYMANQTEVTEKMRTILVDWLVDVHLKFRLHPETLALAMDIVDRYLMVSRVGRSSLQLIGITAMLLAAKYEEIWPPDVKDCIHISANTYTRDELLKTERAICAALQFKLTTPTVIPFMTRLLEATEANEVTKNTAYFFLEHTMMDYKCLQFLPSQLAAASMYLANVMLKVKEPWNFTLQYYGKLKVEEIQPIATQILEYAKTLTNSKYQAIRRKYSSQKFSEVSRMLLPTDIPIEL